MGGGRRGARRSASRDALGAEVLRHPLAERAVLGRVVVLFLGAEGREAHRRDLEKLGKDRDHLHADERDEHEREDGGLLQDRVAHDVHLERAERRPKDGEVALRLPPRPLVEEPHAHVHLEHDEEQHVVADLVVARRALVVRHRAGRRDAEVRELRHPHVDAEEEPSVHVDVQRRLHEARPRRARALGLHRRLAIQAAVRVLPKAARHRSDSTALRGLHTNSATCHKVVVRRCTDSKLVWCAGNSVGTIAKRSEHIFNLIPFPFL